MNSIHFEILEAASHSLSGGFINISPILLKYYPHPSSINSGEILAMFMGMEKEQLARSDGYNWANFLGKKTDEGILWFDDVTIDVGLMPKGKEALLQEQNRRLNEKVSDSVIKTNELTTKYSKAQKRIAILNVITASLNVVAVIVIAIFSLKQSHNDFKEEVMDIKARLAFIEHHLIDSTTSSSKSLTK